MRKILTILGAALAVALSAPAMADASRLGKDLTPMGAERAGNAAGTIPAWDGGLKAAPAGHAAGSHYADPFAADKPLFTIDAANHAQLAGKFINPHGDGCIGIPVEPVVIQGKHK